MSFGDIVIDICQEDDAEKLAELISASKTYWTSEMKGYKLISDETGKDFVRSYESKVLSEMYHQGKTKYLAAGEVILVYQR